MNELQAAIRVAQECGQVIKHAFVTKAHFISTKDDNLADLVTETDKKVEELAFSKLRELFPTHRFIGEENGTTNFCHGFPFVCISIGFTLNKEPTVGVVYNPILDTLFYASKGNGAYLMSPMISKEPLKLPLHASELPSLSSALIATEYGSSRLQDHIDAKIETVHGLLRHQVRGIRSIGTAALSMCLVAEGSIDLYYEAGPHIWDFSAGVVIVREAKGLVTSYPFDSSEGIDLLGRSVICVRGSTLGSFDGSASKQLELVKELTQVLARDSYDRD